MSVGVLVSVYQKAAFILYNLNLFERRDNFYHGETKIAYLYIKTGFWLIHIQEGVEAIADGTDIGSWWIGRQCSRGKTVLLLKVFEKG